MTAVIFLFSTLLTELCAAHASSARPSQRPYDYDPIASQKQTAEARRIAAELRHRAAEQHLARQAGVWTAEKQVSKLMKETETLSADCERLEVDCERLETALVLQAPEAEQAHSLACARRLTATAAAVEADACKNQRIN